MTRFIPELLTGFPPLKRSTTLALPVTSLVRRRFVQGLAGGGVLMGLSPFSRAMDTRSHATRTGSAPVLQGTEFSLEIGESPVNFTGNVRMATTVNGSLPAPTLRWREGDTVTIRVRNRLKETTSIHWHGIILPYQMDGVPGISFAGIPPGETFTYQFKVQQNGTYWYHSHSGMQEATGVYGAIIIDAADSDPVRFGREYVVQLSDWTDDDPMRILAKLKMQGDYYNYHQPTAVDFFQDVSTMGMKAAIDKRKMWNEMRMSPTDLADLSADVLTYLMNGITPAGNWTGLFQPGERVRLRFINGAANTFYDVRIPGLKLTVVQADGINVEPVTVDEFRFGPGETYDVVVQPIEDAYTVYAQAMDRTGYARGTLATHAGLDASVPALDPVEWLAMEDMMGPMDGANITVRHAKTEYGPSTDMRVDMPRTNLDDPGIGLRHNGRRVLTLADLHTLGGPMDARGAEREIELHLTGNMERYAWSFDGVEYGKSTPIHFPYGERIRVILHNDTMMTHPMHLHGMWSELETPDGQFLARRHTIPVQPAQRISFLVTADALGRWAWHCHLMLHMDAGMFREVVVA
jgi:FtsP/CotA-like multicopper oxidase with cupredoxin domain